MSAAPLAQTGCKTGSALLRPVLRNSRRVAALPELAAIREHARQQLEALPAAMRSLADAPRYPVEIAPALHALVREVDSMAHRHDG